MACFHPLVGWRARALNASGRRPIVFDRKKAQWVDKPMKLPCGQCTGCRLEYSRQWAIRCVHESQMHDENCFITLTYDGDHLPDSRSLELRDFQLFMKRLRKRSGVRIRFFHCGEYGDQNGRPHYHALLFGYDFADKVLYKERDGVRLYVSALLSELWPCGFSSVGDVTFESAAYVARYVLKKVRGQGPFSRVMIDGDTGEVFHVANEYATMSRRPGIGATWFEKWNSDVYPSDFLVLRGVKMRPAKFYDGQFEKVDPSALERVKVMRKRKGWRFRDNNVPERLKVREKVQKARLAMLPRNLGKD